MRRFLQRFLGVALMGMMLATPFVLTAQGHGKKGHGHSGGGRGAGKNKSGSKKKGGN